uniref:hypothetical protein n=1 Tax=Yoonia sp. TaxID=2212373 RepID=UPI00404850B0
TYHIKNGESFEQAFNNLKPLGDLCDIFIFGEEYGETGNTPHIQGAFILKSKMRAKTIQDNFFVNGATLRKLKNWESAYNYCKKEGNNIMTNIKEFRIGIELNEWEKDIVEMIKQDADDRLIYWYYGKQGIGKTTFLKWLCLNHGAIVLSGKISDIKNGIIEYKKTNNDTPNIIVSNLAFNTKMDRLDYDGYETIKDMFFYSGKYEGGMICGKNPHLLIFANNPPETENKKFIVKCLDNSEGDACLCAPSGDTL